MTFVGILPVPPAIKFSLPYTFSLHKGSEFISADMCACAYVCVHSVKKPTTRLPSRPSSVVPAGDGNADADDVGKDDAAKVIILLDVPPMT